MQIITQQFSNADSIEREHFNEIMRYLASMLYFYYNKVDQSRPDFPHLHATYQILSQLRTEVDIQSPMIKVLDEEISPDSPLPLFADLVGRSQAMGLMND